MEMKLLKMESALESAVCAAILARHLHKALG